MPEGGSLSCRSSSHQTAHLVVSVLAQVSVSSLSSLTVHGCLVKLDRPGEYKASLVDARFPKRSDAKAAVCLQAMAEGIGNYIRSIASDVDTKVTPAMRSFSSSLVYPALTSELSRMDTNLHPYFEYDKERDGWDLSLARLLRTFSDYRYIAFGATLVVRLSTSPTSEQVRRYTVSSDYRNKADAKVAVICHAAEQGVVEFVCFQGRTPPDGYTSPYILRTYNPDASGKRKRKQLGSDEDAEQSRPAKKKKKKKGKRWTEILSHDESSRLTLVGQYLPAQPNSDQIHGTSRPDSMGLSQSVFADGSCGPSQLAVGSGVGSGAARPAVYDNGTLDNAQMYASPYRVALDPQFAGLGGHGCRVYAVPDAYGCGSHPSRDVDVPLPESGPSRADPRALRRPTEGKELEPGEVMSESEFSESSSRNEDGEVP